MINETTSLIYAKSSIFLNILFEDRYCIYFETSDRFYDHDSFFSDRVDIINKHNLLKCEWFNHKRTTYNIIRRFERRKIKLKKRAYTSILRNYFCADITSIILLYII